MNYIILDRDGVINHDSDNYIKSADEWLPIPGSLQAIADLTAANYQIAIATNQSGIARGLYTEQTLSSIHDKLHAAVIEAGGRIDLIAYCPHRPSDACECRKPKPGLLKQISEHWQKPLNGVPFIGDKISDLQASRQAGCRGILVKTGYGEATLREHLHLPEPVYPDLAGAVAALLAHAL